MLQDARLVILMSSSRATLALLVLGLFCVGEAEKTTALQQAHALMKWTVGIRRHLHQTPELLYELHETSKYVREVLDELGVKYQYPVAQVGIVATIGSGASPCVALRADMDALPIHEEVQCGFKSQNDGKMHACGHDAHVSMLLTAAKILKQREAQMQGTVKLIFQPAEEGGAGGMMMVKQGVLSAEPKIQRIFALHVWPGLPAGTIASRSGTLMAAMGFFHARFSGHGGHAAMPQTTTDPFMCLASALSGLQTIVSRNVNPLEAGVVSTTFVHGGSAYNVIPDKVEMGGTFRSLSKEMYRFIEERASQVMQGAAAAMGCNLELVTTSFSQDCLDLPAPAGAPGSCTFPATVNHPNAWRLAQQAAKALVAEEDVWDAEPTMAGEDFAYFLEHIPGAMVFLGIGNATQGTDVNLHNARFQMDEAQLPVGAALHVEMALRSLDELRLDPKADRNVDCSSSGAQSAQCSMGTNIEGDD